MKSSKIVGKYQVIRKYKPKYIFHFKRNWRNVGSKMMFPKAYISTDVREAICAQPEVMLHSRRYEEEIKYTTVIDYEDYKCFESPNLKSLLAEENSFKFSLKPTAYLFNQYNRFSFGLNQAKVLTKTNVHQNPYFDSFDEDLPESSRSILERMVLKANWWTTDEDKFSKKYSDTAIKRRYASEYGVVPKNMIRYLLNDLFLYSDFLKPSSNNRIFNYNQFMETYYHLNERRIQFHENTDVLITGSDLLPTFENSTAGFDPTQILSELGPVDPMIDLRPIVHYNSESNSGFRDGYVKTRKPQIITVNLDLPNIYTDFLEPEAQQITQSEKDAIGIMKCFAHCVAVARDIFGNDIVDNGKVQLPHPISVVAFCSDGVEFHFICYQLNSTDFSDNSVANFAWIDCANKFYDKIRDVNRPNRNVRYENLNLDVYKKFLTYFKYGC